MQGALKRWKLGSWEGRKFGKKAGDDFQPVQASQLLNFVTSLHLRAGAEVDKQQAEHDRQKPGHPQVHLRRLLDLDVEGLELFRKGEVGNSLQDEDHADDAEEEFQIDIFHKAPDWGRW